MMKCAHGTKEEAVFFCLLGACFLSQGETREKRNNFFRKDWRSCSDDCKKAFAYFEKAVRSDPESDEAWCYVGYCQSATKRLEPAAESYRQVLRFKPDDLSAYKAFPNIEIYAPEGGLYTLLISGKNLPYPKANQLKQRAIAAGFSKETWLWQSSVQYFSSKNN